MSELAEIKSLLEKIDGRLQRVEDIEAIRPLQAEPHWITGVYDAEVVKVDGNWLFKRITSGMNMISPAKDGCKKTGTPPFCDATHLGLDI